MGAVTMFSKEKADFLDIVQSKDSAVYVTDVVQRAVINVDEHGTEAAAASGIFMFRFTLREFTKSVNGEVKCNAM